MTYFHKLPKKQLLTSVLALLGLVALPLSASAKNTISITGSNTMMPINHKLASEYAKINPHVKIEVESRGSETGFKALINNETDIAAASREMTAQELYLFKEKTGTLPEKIVVTFDGIGVYVHSTNPVRQLTVSQLSRIMTGEIQNWQEVGGPDRKIDIFTRDTNSGTRTYMSSHVMHNHSLSDKALTVHSTDELAESVARNQGAIGYGGINYTQGANIIRLSENPGEKGVWPSRENLVNGKYPLSRPLMFY
ncbi:MAG: phosphate ABC transporter substrate-binding protein, partial [Candidatus Omnitrophica bacterium]|nr:phosphate ABC transporter substrate-binding protein [Candidatus Omnitrophota bacterium]